MRALYLFYYLMGGRDISDEILSPPHDTWAECQIARALYEWEGSATSECFALIDSRNSHTINKGD